MSKAKCEKAAMRFIQRIKDLKYDTIDQYEHLVESSDDDDEEEEEEEDNSKKKDEKKSKNKN